MTRLRLELMAAVVISLAALPAAPADAFMQNYTMTIDNAQVQATGAA